MSKSRKAGLKSLLGGLPLMAELDWQLRQRGAPVRGFRLEHLKAALPKWRAQAEASPFRFPPVAGKKVFTFGILPYWIEHMSLVSLALAGVGHKVSMGFLPYGHWTRPVNKYDLRQHNQYGKHILKQAEPVIKTLSLLDVRKSSKLPELLEEAVHAISVHDVQYTELKEEVDLSGDLFKLRLERNHQAALGAYNYLQTERPDVVLLPNGLIMELGAVYQAARYLEIPVVSYEFGEQRERVWLSQTKEVMYQDTNPMWDTLREEPFSEEQFDRIEELVGARQGASTWKNFYRRWQDLPAQGGEIARMKLGLDERPIVLLAANVIGDSLTLNRADFSESMAEWIRRTLAFFANTEGVQFILRAHPGELNTDGPSVVDLANEVLPVMPEHIHIIPPDAKVNTYDLVQIAALGMVYTTTVGLEFAMSGVPVIVVGNTHYRGKGFTYDPRSWDDYYAILNHALSDPEQIKPSKQKVHDAWHYAYRFFFNYPRPFPWHLLHLWDNVETWPLEKVLTEAGLAQFGQTFKYLVGEPVDWRALAE